MAENGLGPGRGPLYGPGDLIYSINIEEGYEEVAAAMQDLHGACGPPVHHAAPGLHSVTIPAAEVHQQRRQLALRATVNIGALRARQRRRTCHQATSRLVRSFTSESTQGVPVAGSFRYGREKARKADYIE